MLDLTQAELARGVGCAAITIRKIERDERRPSRQMAELLAEHLAIPSSQLDAFLRSGRGEMVVAGEGRRSRPGLPGFLNQPDGDDEQTQNAFVARETELARLAGWLQQAVDGSGRIGFVAGEAGRGKSSLLAEFARRSLEQHRKLVVASGICNAFSGTGDPYLPFRDILSMLAGDVESRWSGRSINREQAIRLWRLSPETNRMLLEEGQVLVDVLIPGAHISRVAEQHQDGPAGWREKLHRITEERLHPRELEQQQLFEHFFELLLRLSLRRPLLLMLDDLQWADGATINLLFHLSRRLPESRILVVGSYRTSEVAVGRFEAGAGIDRQHPLKPVVQELKRRFGTIEIDLSRFVPQAGQAFVEAMLDSEPNGLDAEFRQALFWRTKGHPLFTVELLRALQDQGDLFLDDEGRWQATPTLSWDALPARVEAVIAQRVGRLDDATRELLTIASVEGEQFTAQVVGEVMDISERSLLRTLSQELERRHRLVFERDEIEVGHHYLTQYQFRHALFQQYLYNSLSPGEKRVHHGEVARALENVYETARESVTIQLAHHYRQAGERQKALDYSRQAANRAETMYAFEEAIEYVSSALTMIRPGEQRELRMALLEQVADLHVSMGERRQAVAIYQEAVGHHQSMAHAADTTLVRLHRKIGSTIVHMKWYEERQEHVALARRHLSEGLALTEEMPANREGARLLIALAEERWYSRVNPDWASAERYAAKAMDMARELEAPVELSAAMNSMAAVYGARGMLRERVKISMERLELSRDPRFNDERERANILTQVGRALTLIGDYDAAMGHLRLAQEMSRRIQALDTLYYSLRYQAYCHYRLDNWDAVLEIEQQLRQSTERYTNFEERTGPNCFFIALVAAVRGLRGEHGEAERWREESVAAMLANDGPAKGWGRDNLY